jgi:serine O-acetyltransferase
VSPGPTPIITVVPGEPEWEPTGRIHSLASADIQATLFALAVPPSRAAAISHVLFKPGLQAVLLYRVASFLVRRRVPGLPWVVSLLASYLTGAEIGPRAIFGPGMVIYHPSGVVIHGKVRAGRNVRLHSGVVIGVRKGLPNPPRLGDDVRIGANATILGDLSVGDHTRIGANAAVISDVPTGHVALGVPAVSRPRSA